MPLRRRGKCWKNRFERNYSGNKLTILEKIVDVSQICAIILCSAVNIPEQSYDAQYRTGGEVR